MKPLSVTRDSGANVKLLKKLEKDGLIKIHDVMMENGRVNKKVKEKILPTGVWNHSVWGEFVWGSDDSAYDDILKIIGKNHIEDVMHLEAHIRSKQDYFVTEDRDFLDKREELKAAFPVKIVTPTELEGICRQG